jgi:hypothetical protein
MYYTNHPTLGWVKIDMRTGKVLGISNKGISADSGFNPHQQ